MDKKDRKLSGVENFVLNRHLDEPKLHAERSNNDGEQAEEALINMADECDAKATSTGDTSMNRSGEHSPLRSSISFSASQRSQQQQESSSYFGMVISMIRGLIAPPQEIQRALRERDEASQAMLGEQNQELYRAYVSYRNQTKDLEAFVQNCVKVEDVEEHTKAMEETFEQRLAEQAEQHSVHMEQVQEAADKQIVAAKREVTVVQDEKDSKARSCREYEQQIEKLQTAIRNMQAAQLRSIESTQWAALPTSEVENRLKVLHSGVRHWAEDNTEDASIDSVLTPERFKFTARGLLHRGCIRSVGQLRECLMLNKATRKPGKASQVLLSAAVSFDILRKVIGNPFSAFVGSDEDDVLRKDQGEGLEILLDLVRTGDEAGAEALRCQILRLLNRPDTSSDMAEIRNTVKESRGRALNGIVNDIVTEFMGALSERQLSHARNGLEILVQDACVLSWALWTRKARIEVHDWTSLKDWKTGDMSYSANSAMFEAHPLHKRDLEDTPKALDGRSIALLCTPPIFVAGNSDGENYEKRTVLKKGVVWMG